MNDKQKQKQKLDRIMTAVREIDIESLWALDDNDQHELIEKCLDILHVIN